MFNAAAVSGVYRCWLASRRRALKSRLRTAERTTFCGLLCISGTRK